ncbi:hypothetical protein PGTUg99_031950 [Puccinia graminis f. sp. tritici]|uniref:Uncharacterized protein n=1 Tax=Puccinia graminis f. sp. tritici TaxID=56615 RepID=A0A5B0SCW1_PUCGR|nr:hypothetical protein PGTUg99_031950 [Puccinia graminis f. sp. tritici]
MDAIVYGSDYTDDLSVRDDDRVQEFPSKRIVLRLEQIRVIERGDQFTDPIA